MLAPAHEEYENDPPPPVKDKTICYLMSGDCVQNLALILREYSSYVKLINSVSFQVSGWLLNI